MKGCYGSLKAAQRALAASCPLKRPVEVKVCKLKAKEAGFCDLVKGNFVIEINETLDGTARVLTLIHEWAHAMTWGVRRSHGFTWARAYRRAYLSIGAAE